MSDWKSQRIMICGGAGMVGRATIALLKERGARQLIVPQRHLWDLTRQHRAEEVIKTSKPDVIVMAAGRVGGIEANRRNQSQFLYDNAQMALNVINAASINDVKRVIYLGSTCVYPAKAAQPLKESDMLTGPYEPTNAGYALAKTVGIELIRHMRKEYGFDYATIMPCNLYGPYDRFTECGHAAAMLMDRMHRAKVMRIPEVAVWGTGKPLRQFLHVVDVARAILCLIKQPRLHHELYNAGSDHVVSIATLAELIRSTVGYTGRLTWDRDKPDGVAQKWADSQRLNNLGWSPRISLRDGLRHTYGWYLQQDANRWTNTA